MHEDHLVRGKGQDNVSMVHDFELLKWVGANSLRTSHYPYSEEFMDYADAHGIVVIDETAAVGMNAAVAAVLGTNQQGLLPRKLSRTRLVKRMLSRSVNCTSGTRTARASSFGLLPTSRSPTQTSPSHTLNRCSPWPRSLIRIGPLASSTS